jgi:hypothetical protein
VPNWENREAGVNPARARRCDGDKTPNTTEETWEGGDFGGSKARRPA